MSEGFTPSGESTPEDSTLHVTAPNGRERPLKASPAQPRYVALEQVGRGGMGRVLRAYDPKLQREVAVKEVRREALDDESTARLVAEARAMAKLSHPNVVAVYDVEELRTGEVMLVMEFIPGLTLKDWLIAQVREWPAIVETFVQAGRGLAAAHEAGLLHRDFKPANVLVSDGGTVKVTDFGIAKIAAVPASRTPSVHALQSDDDLTETGTVIGTPRYMAPEQHRGQQLSAAADQYALCVALWEALCRKPPFSGETIAEDKMSGPPAWPNSTTPRRIVEAIERGLAPDPANRWPSIPALLAALAWSPSQRRRSWALFAGSVAVLGAAGLGYDAWTHARAQLCAGAEQQLSGVWDGDRRHAVDSAFSTVETAYADTARSRTLDSLDSYAREWAAMHTEACEATAVRGEQSAEMMDRRMVCLQRASRDLKAAVDVLADADAEVIRVAQELTGALLPLSRCADTVALAADVEPPLPDDFEAVEVTRTALASTDALVRAGRYDDAQEALDAAYEAARAVRYGPVKTELALAEALLLDGTGQYEASATKLQDATQLGLRWGPRSALKRAVTEWMYVVGHRLRKAKDALHYRPVAQGLCEGDPLDEAMFHNSLALVLVSDGDLSGAEAEHRMALKLRLDELGPDNLAVAESRGNLSVVLEALGKYTEAKAEHRAALATHEKALGPEHPTVALTRNNLAIVFEREGNYADAEAEYRAALALREAALGPEHPEVAESHGNLGNALYGQGRYSEAAAEHRVALELFEAAFDPAHHFIAQERANLANALYGQGKYAEAEAEHRRVLTVFETSIGPDHHFTALARANLAAALEGQKKYEEAEVQFRRALATLEASLGSEHPNVATLHNNLGGLFMLTGKYAEAEREHRIALATMEASLHADHPDLVKSRVHLAKALLELGRADEVLVLAELAWTHRLVAGVGSGRRAASAFLLARALWHVRGADRDPARAHELAQQSVTAYREEGEDYLEELHEVERWLAEHPLR